MKNNNGGYEIECEAQVIESHIVACHACGAEDKAVVLIWSDGDVDYICLKCKHKERNSVD